MSKKFENPVQLQLPFSEEARVVSAQIFAFSAYRQSIGLVKDSPSDLKKVAEKEILDRILQRAERLSWYK